MITESENEELFIEASESSGLKVLAVLSALLVTALVFAGYAYLRNRHAQSALSQQPAVQPKAPPQALIRVDEAMIQGSNTVLGGTVKNISNEKLNGLSVELEVKRRKDGTVEKKLVALNPGDLDPSQEGRYSLLLKAQDYASAKLTALHSGAVAAGVPYTLAPGEKRPLERMETKTVTVDKAPPGKRSEFLNGPDNPARVP